MSRTYRCKNFEATCQWSFYRAGSKVAGYYTVRERVSMREEGVWLIQAYAYRAPTKTERFKKWYEAHGESRHKNDRSPGSEYRRNRIRQNRSINKEELIRWMSRADYEPLFEQKPRSCLWDWR